MQEYCRTTTNNSTRPGRLVVHKCSLRAVPPSSTLQRTFFSRCCYCDDRCHRRAGRLSLARNPILEQGQYLLALSVIWCFCLLSLLLLTTTSRHSIAGSPRFCAFRGVNLAGRYSHSLPAPNTETGNCIGVSGVRCGQYKYYEPTKTKTSTTGRKTHPGPPRASSGISTICQDGEQQPILLLLFTLEPRPQIKQHAGLAAGFHNLPARPT